MLAADEWVAASAAAARAEVDGLLWRRDVRGAAAAVAASSSDRGARDSAAIDGADIVEADASPMGRVLDAAQRLNADIPSQLDAFERAPLQVLARLHAVVAHGFVPEDELGRPRSADAVHVDDPLHLGSLPAASVAADRLAALALLRLVLASRGVDPSLFSIPEHGIWQQGRPAYVKALRAYASGTPEGVRDFLVWNATAIGLGAAAVVVPATG